VTRWLIVIGVLMVLGCDGVGRALVGEELAGVDDDLACQRPSCQEQPLPIAPRVRDSEPLGVALCAQRPDSTLCDRADDPRTGAEEASQSPCGEPRLLDEDSGEALRRLDCVQLSLQRTAEAGAGVLRISDARWRGLTLVIESEDAFVLELERAVLEQVRVTLRGPVTLRVIDSVEVAELMVTTDDRAAALEVRESRVRALWLGGADLPFAGTLDAQRSTIAMLTAFVRAASFESVLLDDVRASAERLELSDVTGRRLLLAADQIIVNVSSLSELEIERCGRLGAYQTWLTSFRIPACRDDATRLYGGTMRRGAIEGSIVADRASFDRTRFGVRDATELQLWDASLENTSLCAGTGRVTIGGDTSALCVFCKEDDDSPVPVQACLHPESAPILLRACRALVEAPVCEPAPQRMRPPLD
jgi:hypothetical protein